MTAAAPRTGVRTAEPRPVAGAEQFVELFAAGWRAPKPEGFIDAFRPVLHPAVRLVQPTIPPAHGHAGFERSFRELFGVFPDYEVTVDDWAARGNVVYLCLTHATTVSGRRLSWEGIDRVTLADGLVRERVAYFDPTPLLPALARAPRSWPQMLRWTLASVRGIEYR